MEPYLEDAQGPAAALGGEIVGATPAHGQHAVGAERTPGWERRQHVHATEDGGVDVLALYDIHGNLDALEAVLADPRASDPDALVIGGDAVPGPYAAATLARLEAIAAPVHWIRGNGEREVAAAIGGPPPAEDDMALVTAAITAAELGEERARALGELPLTVELDGVLYCHATPRSDEEILTRLSPPERWAEAFAGVGAGLVVAGHTHQQDDRHVGDLRFLNAATVAVGGTLVVVSGIWEGEGPREGPPWPLTREELDRFSLTLRPVDVGVARIGSEARWRGEYVRC